MENFKFPLFLCSPGVNLAARFNRDELTDLLHWSIWREVIFIEDSDFQKRRIGLMDDEEFFRFAFWMMSHPQDGDTIPRSGGLRKIRWAAKGRGKRGGVRIIYFWWNSEDKILLLDIYSKNEKENLTAKEIDKLKRKVT